MIYKRLWIAEHLLLCAVSVWILCCFRPHPEGENRRSWQCMQASGELRIGVLLNPMEYYISQGKEGGFSYDLSRTLSQSLGLKPVYTVFYTYEAAYKALLLNKIDLMAVGELPSPEWAPFFEYTRAVAQTDLVLLQHKEHRILSEGRCTCDSAAELKVSLPMKFVEESARIKQRYKDSVHLCFYAASFDQLMTDVNENGQGMMLAYGPQWKANRYMFPQLEIAEVLADSLSLHWLVRRGNDTLLSKCDSVLSVYESTRNYPRLLKKYNDPVSRERSKLAAVHQTSPFGAISRYDTYMQKYGSKYHIDWYMLASLIYQESKFHPDVVGKGNTFGLMQFSPGTGHKFGVNASSSPEQQIEGGCRYLNRLRQILEKEGVHDSAQLVPMVLAAYNAGSGHLIDAIAIASEEEHLNPQVWEGGVKEALLLLGEHKYARHPCVKHGIYRGCRHTIRYVDAVLERGEHYKTLVRRDSLVEVR